MKNKPTLITFIALSMSLPCVADTFTLKDGTTLEGTVLSETPDTYTLEVQVTKSIKDERKVPKADVVKVSRERPDVKAFEALGKMDPTPDLMTEDDYAEKIRALEKFLKAYPDSSVAKDAQKILSNLKAEVADVSDGGIKLNGKMIKVDDYKPNAYELDARVAEAKIRAMVAERHLLEALRAFTDFDRDYRTTQQYDSLATLMKQVIQAHVAEANQLLQTFDERTKKREAGVLQMAPEDRGITQAAIKEEADAIEARYKSEKGAGLTWPTISPFHRASLEETVRLGQSELARMAASKPAADVDGGKAYRELYNAVHNGGNAAAVSSALNAARTARIPARYIEPLEAAAKGRK